MSNWAFWSAVPVVLLLLLFSTLHLALYVPSRARLAEQLRLQGRGDELEAFLARRAEYLLATGVVRALLVVALLLLVLLGDHSPGAELLRWEKVIPLAVATFVMLVFGVAIPIPWAKYSGPWLVAGLLPLVSFVRFVCYPIVVVLAVLDPFVRRLAGVPKFDDASQADVIEREILDAVSEGERRGAVDEEEKEMIESVIELTDTRVDKIMTPRTEIVAIPKDVGLDEVLASIREKGHSRIPVYDDTIDTILGVLYAKDLLRRNDQDTFALTSVMRKCLFVPESKPVRDLLREFQQQKVHIAIVLDEYGGTAGLITIEDIVEELVGEITDEYESDAPPEFHRVDENVVEVDARMRIDDLNDELGIELPEDEDFETIGGLVFSALGKIPESGESCRYHNVGIQVIASEPRRILRVRLEVALPHPGDETDS